MSSDRLSGKIVAVTGASSGIGRNIAEKAVAEGAKVIIIARRERRLEELAVQLGQNCKPFVFDVTEYNGNVDLFEILEQIFSAPLCALVNNAGIYVDHKLGEYTVRDFDNVINTNLKAPFFWMQGYVNYCKKRGADLSWLARGAQPPGYSGKACGRCDALYRSGLCTETRGSGKGAGV